MEKNTIKFYNLIFPFWIMILIPPMIILAIVGNLIIDSLIVIVVLKINGYYARLQGSTIRMTILKVFGLGFLADIVGMTFLIVLYGVFDPTINYFYIWDNPISIIVHLIVVGLTGALIFFLNKLVFKTILIDETVIFRLALSMAIITAPWTFLIPVMLFNY